MSVYYKFKSELSKDLSTVFFDGSFIHCAQLKLQIIDQRKLGKFKDFDLELTNSQTHEGMSFADLIQQTHTVVYANNASIPKNTTLVVRRIPLSRDIYGAPLETKSINTKTSDIRPLLVNVVPAKQAALKDERKRDAPSPTPSPSLAKTAVPKKESNLIANYPAVKDVPSKPRIATTTATPITNANDSNRNLLSNAVKPKTEAPLDLAKSNNHTNSNNANGDAVQPAKRKAPEEEDGPNKKVKEGK